MLKRLAPTISAVGAGAGVVLSIPALVIWTLNPPNALEPVWVVPTFVVIVTINNIWIAFHLGSMYALNRMKKRFEQETARLQQQAREAREAAREWRSWPSQRSDAPRSAADRKRTRRSAPGSAELNTHLGGTNDEIPVNRCDSTRSTRARHGHVHTDARHTRARQSAAQPEYQGALRFAHVCRNTHHRHGYCQRHPEPAFSHRRRSGPGWFELAGLWHAGHGAGADWLNERRFQSYDSGRSYRRRAACPCGRLGSRSVLRRRLQHGVMPVANRNSNRNSDVDTHEHTDEHPNSNEHQYSYGDCDGYADATDNDGHCNRDSDVTRATCCPGAPEPYEHAWHVFLDKRPAERWQLCGRTLSLRANPGLDESSGTGARRRHALGQWRSLPDRERTEQRTVRRTRDGNTDSAHCADAAATDEYTDARPGDTNSHANALADGDCYRHPDGDSNEHAPAD